MAPQSNNDDSLEDVASAMAEIFDLVLSNKVTFHVSKNKSIFISGSEDSVTLGINMKTPYGKYFGSITLDKKSGKKVEFGRNLQTIPISFVELNVNVSIWASYNPNQSASEQKKDWKVFEFDGITKLIILEKILYSQGNIDIGVQLSFNLDINIKNLLKKLIEYLSSLSSSPSFWSWLSDPSDDLQPTITALSVLQGKTVKDMASVYKRDYNSKGWPSGEKILGTFVFALSIVILTGPVVVLIAPEFVLMVAPVAVAL